MYSHIKRFTQQLRYVSNTMNLIAKSAITWAIYIDKKTNNEKNEEGNVQLLKFKSFDHNNYITGFLCFLSGRIYNSPLQETHICEVIGHYSRPPPPIS